VDPTRSKSARDNITLARSGNQFASSVLVQPDGNIVVAGETDESGTSQFLVQRFLSTGAPDTAFGSAGVVLAPLATQPSAIGKSTVRMALMVDGRIVIGGDPGSGIIDSVVLTRVLPDGTLDPTFGPNGKATVYLGSGQHLGALTLAGDGKILLAGSLGGAPGGSYIARLWN
jgi:uncharacterized delta-60 repeat protein